MRSNYQNHVDEIIGAVVDAVTGHNSLMAADALSQVLAGVLKGVAEAGPGSRAASTKLRRMVIDRLRRMGSEESGECDHAD
jgi:hypothetical protein